MNLSNASNAVVLAGVLASISTHANANLTFTQTVDGWFENKFTWNAQIESVTLKRNLDNIGTVRTVWARVVQKNGSQAGTAVFCTTMVKTATAGLTDTWAVSVPAGTICDGDFWDATILCVEIVQCGRIQRLAYNSIPSPAGRVGMVDLPPIDIDLNPNARYVSLDPIEFDTQVILDQGFDLAVYAYLDPFTGIPIILNHLDPLTFSTFIYDQNDAFGTGLPFQQDQFQLLGIDLDPLWDQLPKQSTGLNDFQWQVFPQGGGLLQTDQGDFQIMQIQPIIEGWEPLCPADYTGDGILDFFDISEFVTLFGIQHPDSDFNGDGQVDFFDISLFLQAYSDGCAQQKKG
ncbi:MAG: GC-type dockerin domain-anchored protein [Phycisphaerales bacterium]